MRRRIGKAKKLVLSLLGIAVVLPLATTSASAEIASGFKIRAYNTADPSINAEAGLLFTGDLIEDNDDPAAPAFSKTFSCGPQSFTINQAMLDLNKANRALLSAGRAGEMQPWPKSGWKVFQTQGVNNNYYSGYPTSAGFAAKQTIFTADPGTITKGNLAVLLEESAGKCRIYDYEEPAANKRFGYLKDDSTNQYIDFRYESRNGQLILTGMGREGDTVTLRRSDFETRGVDAEGGHNTAKSTTHPSIIRWSANGDIAIEVSLPEKVDGYNTITIYDNADGSGFTRYYDRPLGPNPTPTFADRQLGPNQINRDASGKITTSGNKNPSWDGSYHRTSMFNLDRPFTPQAP